MGRKRDYKHRENPNALVTIVHETVVVKMTLHQEIKMLESILPDLRILAESGKALPSNYSHEQLTRFRPHGLVDMPAPSFEAAPLIATLCGCLNIGKTTDIYSNQVLLEAIEVAEKWVVRLNGVNDASIILAGASKKSSTGPMAKLSATARGGTARNFFRRRVFAQKPKVQKSGRGG